MTGGLYRSANAASDSGPPPADGAMLISAQPLDAAGVEPPGNPPPGAGPAPADPDGPGTADDTAGAHPAGDGSDGGGSDGGGAAGNSAVMAVLSLVSRATGFLRTMLISAALGGALIGDAYTTAQFFPGMIYELLLGGILTSVVIPVLVRRRKSDADRGQAYTQRLLTLTVLTLGTATVLAVVAAPVLSRLYAGDENGADYRNLVTYLSYLMLPIMFFSGLSALFAGVLNTRGQFAAPMWTPILNNLVVLATAGAYIAVFGIRGNLRPAEMTTGQILLIGGGTLFGIVVQAVGLWPALRRVGFRWRWRFDFRELGLRELGRLGGWVFCYVAVSQIGVFVVLRLLNSANSNGDTAGPIIYNNVYLLMMMAHGVVAVSIITALMPRMSAAAADGRHADVAADLSRGSRMTAAVLAPIAVCYAVLAEPISIVLFDNGAYSRQNALATAVVLMVAAVALIPFAISQLFTFALYALTDTKAAALVNVPVVAIRIGVQVALFSWLEREFAAAGLMAGNAVSYLVAVVLTAVLLRSRIGRLGIGAMLAGFARVLLAAGVAALVGLLAVDLLLGPAAADAGKLWNLVALAVGGALVCAVYGGAALLLRVREVTQVVAMVRRRIGR